MGINKGAMPEFMGSNCWRYRVENQYTIKLMEVLEIKIVLMLKHGF